MGIARRYVELLQSRPFVKFVILAFWLCLCVMGVFLVGPFLAKTTNDMAVPPSAPSFRAREKAKALGFDFFTGLFRVHFFLQNQTNTSAPLDGAAADAAMSRMRKIVDHQYPDAVFWDGFLFSKERGELLTSQSFVSNLTRSQIANALVRGKPVSFMVCLNSFG